MSMDEEFDEGDYYSDEYGSDDQISVEDETAIEIENIYLSAEGNP